MMLSTKARRVSVGARAGNARRSALRPRMRGAVPNVGREGLAGSSGARPGGTRNACPRGRSPTRGESGCRRPEIRLRERPAPLGTFGMRMPKTPQPPARKPSGEKFRTAPSPGPADRGKQREPPAFRAARGRPGQCLKPMTPGSLPFPRGWGPRTALPQDSATGAAAPGVPTRWAFPVPGNREDSPEGSGARPGETRNAYPRGSRRRRRGNSSGEPQPESGPEGVQTDSKTPEQTSLPRDFPKAQHPALNPRPRQAVRRQRPQEARREKKRTKQSCSVRLPDCYSAAFCAASARASASLARASASFRFAAVSFSFASAS